METHRLFLFVLLSLSSVVHAQRMDENDFVKYTTADGLSHNSISGIVQDSVGYVWIATSSGLNRFDGRQFVQFHSSADNASITAEDLSGITLLNNRKIAVFTAGVHIIDAGTSKSRNLFVPYGNLKYQYKFNMIERALGDKNGHVYVLSRSGFYHFDSAYRILSRFDFYPETDVPLVHFHFGRDLFELDSNRLLIVAIDGLYVYDKLGRKLRRMVADDCPAMAIYLNYPVTFYTFLQHTAGYFFILQPYTDTIVYIDVKKNRRTASKIPFNPGRDEFHFRTRLVQKNDRTFLLTGHNAGFYKIKLDSATGRIHMSPRRYLESYLCNALLFDRDGLLWVATNRGVLRESPTRAGVELAQVPETIQRNHPNLRIDDVYVSGDRLYAGTRANAGLLSFDINSLQFKKQILFDKYDNRGNNIYSITRVDQKTILLGTDRPLLLFNGARETHLKPPGWDEGQWTSDLYRSRNGIIWVSSYHVYQYAPSTGRFDRVDYPASLLNVPFVIEEDRDGNIWMAGHGLARFNTSLNKFDLVLDSFPYSKLPDLQVNAMVIDNANRLWFNCKNNGLTSYDIATGTYQHFTRKHGLHDDNIAALAVHENHLWIACFSGLACMDLRTGNIVSFSKSDGFPDMPIVKGARFHFDSSASRMYIGFATAVARFDPIAILQPRSPPQVFIEELSFNEKSTYFLPAFETTTSWEQNGAKIRIGSINFSDSRDQAFAYRVMRDDSTEWQQLGSQPSFSISSLLPGRHRIQVQCYSTNNRWLPQVKEFVIVVQPPFYYEYWFIAVVVASLFLFVYLLVQWRTNLARSKEQEKTRIEKLKADDYKNQFELEQISNYFTSSLAKSNSVDAVLWDVAKNLIGRMNYEDCVIYLWNNSKTFMVQKAAYGPKGRPEIISNNPFTVKPGQGIVGEVIRTRLPILVSDTRLDSRYRVDDAVRLSEVAVPIIHDDELLGVIDSEHRLPNYYSQRDIKILTTIATLIGNKLKQLESEQSLRAKQQELAGINEQLAEARLSALQAQMNPHFVFNALNSIKRMILECDNERASRYLSKFALMIRMTLEQSKDIFITLDENMQYLHAYLEMERLRFDDSFVYDIHADSDLDTTEISIPSMMIQPLVENAVWHGLMHTRNEKKILISFSQFESKLVCTVEDNGIGIRQSEKIKSRYRPLHRSVGLENLRNRIKIMNEKYGLDCSLEIIDRGSVECQQQGTTATLKFNLMTIG